MITRFLQLRSCQLSGGCLKSLYRPIVKGALNHLFLAENLQFKLFFASYVLISIVLRFCNLYLIRLYPNLYSKHSEINKKCDFLVLIDNQIYSFALRRRIECPATSLHAYDNKHITSNAKGFPTELVAQLLIKAKHFVPIS